MALALWSGRGFRDPAEWGVSSLVQGTVVWLSDGMVCLPVPLKEASGNWGSFLMLAGLSVALGRSEASRGLPQSAQPLFLGDPLS